MLLQVADLVEVHNQDARDFLRTQGQPEAIAALVDKRIHNRRGHSGLSAAGAAETSGSHRQAVEVHVIMNLPELAVEFLGGSLSCDYHLTSCKTKVWAHEALPLLGVFQRISISGK